MWPFGNRRRFRDLVERQLAIFASDHGELVARAREAHESYVREPDADRSLEAYGEHDELAEEIEELLDEMYRRYASTLEADSRRQYRRAFAKAARSTYGDLLPRLSFDSDEDMLPE